MSATVCFGGMMLPLREAIILARSEPWVVDGAIIDKAMLSLGYYTLLDHQLKWLTDNGFEHIVIASDKEYRVYPVFLKNVEFSLEGFPLGTGGAVLKAIDLISDKHVYVMNIDSIVLGWNPQLMQFPEAEAKILVTKPRLPFGRVDSKKGYVTRFVEKPILDLYASCGHYCFSRHVVERCFPDIGSIEEKVLPKLASERKLMAERLSGTWVHIDSPRDVRYVTRILESLK